MRWSWKLGEFSGIGVYVHATFSIIILWVAITHWAEGEGFEGILAGVLFVLAIFACVVFHEFGHALMAQRFGIGTRDITLLPIGGVARLERMPEDPKQELAVALAGPAVNVGIAAGLYGWLWLTSSLLPFENLGVVAGPFWERLMVINVFLVVFNMLPAFPMDGGRVVRALLAQRMSYVRATQLAASLGQGMALLFGLIGFFSNPFLLFIAFFVWIGATQEASMVQIRSALGGIPVNHAMVTDYHTLAPEDNLERAIEMILAGSQQDFPVVEKAAVVGVLTRQDLLRVLAERGKTALVSEVMQRDIQVVDSSEMLESAFQRLQACQCHTLPVQRSGQLVGLLTMDNVGEFISIQSALKTGRI
jgi:Zn-dependent protease/predicted transcriptional regulator